MLFLIILILVILAIVLNNPKIYNKNNIINEQYNLTNYTTKRYIMTSTELNFYRNLKQVANELNLEIFPQVNLERIIQTKDNNFIDRNRIKSKSIDYTLVNNKNCKIIACIELDDYTHNKENVKINDEFKNLIFKQVNIPLFRIKVKNYYDLKELKEELLKIINNSN